VHVDQNERFWLLGLPITVTVGAVVDSRSLKSLVGTSNLGTQLGPERGPTPDFTWEFQWQVGRGTPDLPPTWNLLPPDSKYGPLASGERNSPPTAYRALSHRIASETGKSLIQRIAQQRLFVELPDQYLVCGV
jgi:hypothetical protein